MKIFYSLAIASLVLGACRSNPDAVVSLKVSAADNKGNPLGDAEVLLDHTKLGQTDSLGAMTKTVFIKKGSTPVIEVRREDQRYYYSPYINKQMLNEQESQAREVKAVLYAVPKFGEKDD